MPVFTSGAGSLPPAFHDVMPSPDGTMMAGHYADQAARGERIAVLPAAGGPARLMNTVPPSATWAPDGRSLIYIDTRAGISNLVRQPLAGGAPTPLTRFASELIFTYGLSPDQRLVGLVRGHVNSDVVLISTAVRDGGSRR